MSRRVHMGIALTTLLLVAMACSESRSSSKTDNGAAPITRPGPGDCSSDLLACARTTSIEDLVPEQATKAIGTPITIGMINQENTAFGSFPELSQAARAAAAFVNDQLGGVDGHPIDISVCDTRFSAEQSVTCAQGFVEQKVPVVLGGIDIWGTGIDTLAANKVPYVGGIPVSDQSAKSPNSFQFSGGTWGAVTAFADDAVKRGDKSVATVYMDFGSITESAQIIDQVLRHGGVKSTLVPFPLSSNADMKPYVDTAVAAKPDAIIMLAADQGCPAAYEALAEDAVTARVYMVGACAAPNIINPAGEKAVGKIFNVEGPVSNTDPDTVLYGAIMGKYEPDLDPQGAGTVTFRSFMNLYAVLRGVGAAHLSPATITEHLRDARDVPSFMGHAYTCDGKQFPGTPAFCSPQQILAERTKSGFEQLSKHYIDVGAIARAAGVS